MTSVQEAKKQADILAGVLIETQYPVEEFTLQWTISNYSKIFNDIEARFSTTSKSTSWIIKLCPIGRNKKISLWKDFNGQPVTVQFKATIKTCHNILKNEGTYKAQAIYDHFEILHIPESEFDSNDKYHSITFENDVFNFHCTMTILGHTITNTYASFSSLDLKKKQINIDLENRFSSKEHCDVVISHGTKKIPVHKAILCARSPIFNVMFQHDMMENKNQEVEIEDVEFSTLENFIRFLYSGTIENLCSETAMKLYCIADKYEIKDLQTICSQFLQLQLTVDEACNVLRMADLHKDNELRERVVFFIQMHATAVKLTEGWKELVKTWPKLAAQFF